MTTATLGAVDEIRAAAVASMPHGMLAGLMRRHGERWSNLLLRLDEAVMSQSSRKPRHQRYASIDRGGIRGVAVLSYVYFGTNNLDEAIAFYNATLAPLDMERCLTGDPEWDRIAAGWGIYEDGGARELGFWIGKPFDQKPASVGNGSMMAFSARSWKAVDDFYAAALANGGMGDDAPGLRLHYAPDFYAALCARS